MGVDGLIYMTLVSYLVAWAVGTCLADRFLHARLDILSTAKILADSTVSYVIATFLPSTSSMVLNLAADIVVFFGVYLALTPLVRAIRPGDLDLMERDYSSGLPVDRECKRLD